MTNEARETKGQVSEHYRKQLLKVQKRVEEATKVSERTVRRILGEQKSMKRKELHSVRTVRHTKCRNV
jgi:hypothetical protein